MSYVFEPNGRLHRHRRRQRPLSRCGASTAWAATTPRTRARWAATDRDPPFFFSQAGRRRGLAPPGKPTHGLPAADQRTAPRDRARGGHRQGAARTWRSRRAGPHLRLRGGLDMTRRDLQAGCATRAGRGTSPRASTTRPRSAAIRRWAGRRTAEGAISVQVTAKTASAATSTSDLERRRDRRATCPGLGAGARRPDLHRHARGRGRGGARRHAGRRRWRAWASSRRGGLRVWACQGRKNPPGS